jgi:hypothetical protein
MTDHTRQAVLRHLDLLALVHGEPEDLDEFLGLPEGTTLEVMALARKAEPRKV